MNAPSHFGYFLAVTEHDRFMGSKPDGYLVFITKEDADAYVEREYANRVGTFNAPDYYLSFADAGWHPITTLQLEQIRKNGKFTWANTTNR